MLKKLLLAIAIAALVAVPANAEDLATLQANDTYTMTVTNGANNADATGVVILAVTANGLRNGLSVSSADMSAADRSSTAWLRRVPRWRRS